MTSQQTLTEAEREAIKNLTAHEFWTLYREFAEVLKDEAGAKAILIERGRHDVEAFAIAFFPHFCRHPFNEFHHMCFTRWHKARTAARIVDAAPRGSAKSTLKTLIKPIHDVCYAHEKFIVIFSNTASQACSKLKDIRSELLENQLLINHFGSFFKYKKTAETRFTTSCNGFETRFEAYGARTEVRGIKFGEARPSKIILDDAEHSEEVANEEIRKKYEDWFKEVVSKLGDENTIIDVTGTVLHKQALLVDVMKNPVYEASMYKAIISWSEREDLWEAWRKIYANLDDPERLEKADAFYRTHEALMLQGTKVLWPERASYLDLMKEMFEIGKRAFMKEMQHEPQSSDTALFSDIWWFTEEVEGYRIEKSGILVPHTHLLSSLGAMDPATGQTKAKTGKLGDFTSIVSGRVDTKDRLFVHSDWTRRVAPAKFIQAIYDLHDLHQYDKFGVETNLYRNLLIPNIEMHRKEVEKRRRKEGIVNYAIQLPFYDIETIENKQKRIFTLEPKVTNGYILFNKSLSQEFMGQIEAFPDPSAHDDGPDALEMLWSMAKKRFGMGGVNVKTQRGR